jgi:hypothetical protein
MTAKPANAAAARPEAVANEGITPDTYLIAPSPLDSTVLPARSASCDGSLLA